MVRSATKIASIRVGGQRCTCKLRQVKQLAPSVNPTPDVSYWARLASGVIELAEPGISIELQDTGIPCQVLLRVLTPAASPLQHLPDSRLSDVGPCKAAQ